MKRIKLVRLMLGLFALLLPQQAAAYMGICCGKCGGNMPMNIAGGGVPETHEFRFKINPELMHMQGLRSGTTTVDGGSLLGNPALGKYMAVQERMDMSMLNISAGYSFSERFFAGVMGMYVDKRMDMKFSSMMSMPAMAGVPGFTMKSHGVGDTMLMAKYLLWADDILIPSSQVSLFAGLSLPTGSISQRNSEHPMAVRKNELLPYGMQLGTGTYDPTLGLLYQGSNSPMWWGLNGMYTARLHDNSQGYRHGNRGKVDAYLMYQPRVDTVLELQLNGTWDGTLKGQANAALSGASGHAVQGNAASPFMTPLWDTNNYGGTQLFATTGVQWQPMPFNIINAQVSLPLYRRLNGVQMETDWRVSLTWYVELPTAKSIRSQKLDHGPSHLGF
ncbi:transporter [Mariprofundus sp. EBB-1]|uniref:transporter n=1 Tax=Mariprofundus sp. EBB-1 TaxID=2650971 RepID=UPI000EF18632|nr:transporter [Mariprofundus sp. EBB-1]RLL50996.1 transporter [Mariprofundus sp. EBB-1]